MKILPLLGQDECGLCVCTRTRQHRGRACKRRREGGREENMLPASRQESSGFHLRRLLSRLPLGQPKTMWICSSKHSNIPGTQKHRVNKVTADLWNATSLLLHTTVREGKPAKHKHWSKDPRLLSYSQPRHPHPGRYKRQGQSHTCPSLTNSLASGRLNRHLPLLSSETALYYKHFERSHVNTTLIKVWFWVPQYNNMGRLKKPKY